MENQATLFQQRSSWMHYIGGHYKTMDKFIKEAQKIGITRRIPGQVARGMQFGDRVVLLRWGGNGKVTAFAEMVIESVTFDNGLAREVGEKLKAEGRAMFTDGGGLVERECGWYLSLGTWSCDAEIDEIMEIATKVAKEKGVELFTMIGGRLIRVYEEPVLLSPAPKFTRGFIRSDDQATFEYEGPAPERNIVAIQDYHKRDWPE